MNYTSNYQLNQWEAGDRVQRTDFNADNAKIDAALAALAAETGKSLRIVMGEYTGDGSNRLSLTLGLRPIMMVIMQWKDNGDHIIQWGNDFIYYERTPSFITQPALYYTMTLRDDGVDFACTYSISDTERAEYVCNKKDMKYRYAAIG